MLDDPSREELDKAAIVFDEASNPVLRWICRLEQKVDLEIPVAENGLRAKVQEVLEAIRPSLMAHGGDVTLVEITPDNIARLQLEGACNGCPMSQITLKMGIERVLAEEVPELAGVEAVGLEDVDWSEFK